MGHTLGGDGPGVWSELDELVTKVVSKRVAIAALQAGEAELLADAVDLVVARTQERLRDGKRIGNEIPLREVSAELGAAMRMSDRTVQGRMGDATTIVRSFAATHAAWRAGRIDAGHVSAIIDAGVAIADTEARARYEKQVLEAAAHESPGRLRPLARIIAGHIDPECIDERHRVARSRRGVRVVDLDDGMARLTADLPATLAYAIHDRLTQQAHHVLEREPHTLEDPLAAAGSHHVELQSGGAVLLTGPARTARPEVIAGVPDASVEEAPEPPPDTRSMDEVRADVFADLLLTAVPTAHGDRDALGAISGRVQVTIPILTAAGIGNEPALLAGHGPIDSDTARRLAAGAPGWDRVMTHPHTGAPLAVDRYRPSSELRRFVAVRDEHCRFPGCRMAIWRCDADHTIDAARGGPTSEDNLAYFCRRHHTLKHASEWKVRQLGGGVLEWTSPTRRQYLDRPPLLVRFVPDPTFAAVDDGDRPPF